MCRCIYKEHAICKNAANTDFYTIFSVAEFVDGDYSLGLIIYYKTADGTTFSYFGLDNRFTVLNGSISNAKIDMVAGTSDETIDPSVVDNHLDALFRGLPQELSPYRACSNHPFNGWL